MDTSLCACLVKAVNQSMDETTELQQAVVEATVDVEADKGSPEGERAAAMREARSHPPKPYCL